MAVLDLGVVKIVPFNEIEVGVRTRESGGDIMGLANSIKTVGLIHPLAVYSPTGEPPYKLLAGGRRYLALRILEAEEVSIRLYLEEKSEDFIAAVELFENIDRKNFEQGEEVKLTARLHNFLETMRPGHSMRDTARLINRSIGTVSQDIALAQAMEKFPEFGLDKLPNKTVARKVLSRISQAVNQRAQLDSLEAERKSFKSQYDEILEYRLNAYKVGDFFKEYPKLPTASFNLIEIDPPWAIDEGNYFDGVANTSYVEENKDTFEAFIERLAEACWYLAAKDSWVLWWFGQEWHIKIYEALLRQGFVGGPVPAIWAKRDAANYSRAPYTALSSHYEPFLYLRKGDAKLNNLARSNIFQYPMLHPSKRIHPTERPIELMLDILGTFAFQGARVCVPFAGSGNTLQAAFGINMTPIGFDLSQEFKDSYGLRTIREHRERYPSGESTEYSKEVSSQET